MEAIKLELQLNNKNREDGLKITIHGSHSYNFLKGSAIHRGIQQQLPLPIPVFIILYVHTPSSLGPQPLSIAFPPDNAPPPLLIPTILFI
jgi:hypothetical protein